MAVDKINNGEYNLIARNGEEIEIIPINRKWYLKDGITEIQRRFDLAAIDLVFLNFNNVTELKQQMFKNGYINSPDVTLFITKRNKYDGKVYLKEHDLLFNENEKRTELIKKLAKKRLDGEKITFDETEEFITKFFSKLMAKESFFKFITFTLSGIDEYLKKELLYSKKNNDLSFQLKHKMKDKFESYHVIRNIITAWNLYDKLYKELTEKYKDENYNESKLGDMLVRYVFNSKNHLTNERDEVIGKTDKNQVAGQITMEGYLKKTEEPREKTYAELMDEYDEASRLLKESPFSDQQIRTLYEKGGLDEVFSNITAEKLKNLSLDDQYRLGRFDFVEYNRLKRIETSKGNSR